LPLPDTVSYATAMRSAARSREHWREALRLLDVMASRGVRPNAHAYAAAAVACETGGRWEVAISLLDRMREQGLRASVIVHSTHSLLA